MVESLPFSLFMGCLLGFLSGIGIGGGSLLLLWLTLVLKLPQETARDVNLLFFIPTALIASLFRWKQGALKLKEILPAVLAGCVSAALFTLVGRQADTALLKKLFGALLLVTGLRELFYRCKDQPRFRKAR
ncbi:MAG: sulfite exporter TauE/SafE family protein [Oscillospiraceae bacterium]|nr:sulfite exporter TauE/SafE family protein [Oscillospiraceae bacterium]